MTEDESPSCSGKDFALIHSDLGWRYTELGVRLSEDSQAESQKQNKNACDLTKMHTSCPPFRLRLLFHSDTLLLTGDDFFF